MRYLLFAVLTLGSVASVSASSPTPATSVSEDSKTTKATTDAVSGSDKSLRCRKVEVTGSLVKKGRVCKTLAEWRAIMESNNTLARKLVEDGTTRPGGQ
ncbi:hypothetical protein [Sphingorhabdus sp.]|uniref:hypothetical protein n=1 Tax=Sphingorhabdus sp. TaxID=1902408 RepID=UPI00391B8BCA